MLIVPTQPGKLEAAPTTCPLPFVADFIFTGQQGQVYKASHDPTEFIAAFLLAAARDEEEMRKNINGAAAWFGGECRWTKL